MESTGGTDSLLRVDHLSVSFGSRGYHFKAVNDLSFSVQPGRVLGIVGESGSGKSVTSLSLMQLIDRKAGRTDAGTALLSTKKDGLVDLLSLSSRQIRKHRGNDLAMIFQEPMTSLNPVFTCGNQVSEVLSLHLGLTAADARIETIRLFEQVRLPRAARIYDSFPHQLSGGQKQRVMIAMAISCKPRLLIADEPTTALDVTVQAAILDLLREIQVSTGMGMLFITHDLGVISRIADEVLVMYKGQGVDYKSSQDLFGRPEHPYTRGLLACRPSRHLRLKRLPVISDFMMVDADGTFRETGTGIDELVNSLQVTPGPDPVAAREQNQPLLSVSNLNISFPVRNGLFGSASNHVKAVDAVSFEVFKGETLGLVGESGCGKTTLSRAILRLLPASDGSIHFNGQDITINDRNNLRLLRKKMQLIFQDPYSSLNPRLTAGEAIMEPMKVHRLLDNDDARRERTLELMRRVGLSEMHFHRFPHQFSGGQRQRICIARALALEPEFVVCDESVSALDVSVQAQVLNLLNELKEECGLTYIFISHDLSVVRFMSNRMMVMKDGRIEEMGDTESVYQDPKSDYTRRLINAIPR